MTNLWYSLKVACLPKLFFSFFELSVRSTEMSLSHQEGLKGNIFVCGLIEKKVEGIFCSKS